MLRSNCLWPRAVAALICLVAVACSSTPSSSQSISSQKTEGAYRLSFRLPKTEWRVDEPISGEAELALVAGEEAIVSGSGENIFGFEFAREGGPTITPVWPASCGDYAVRSDSPLVFPIEKSGTVDPDYPNAPIMRRWMTDPLIYLPAGNWRITAIALFHEGPECGGGQLVVRLPLEIRVAE